MKTFYQLFFFTLFTLPLSATDYYWVGGNGNWSNISNWATTSGGNVTHNTAPTADDNVIFDQNSFSAANQQVTLDGDIAFCRDMVWMSGTQGARFSAASTATLNIFGSLMLTTDMSFDFQGNVRFQGSNSGNTIDMAGHNFLKNVTFDGLGADWTLQSDMVVDALLYHYKGSLTSAGQTITCERFYTEIVNSGSILNLNGSDIIVTGIDELYVYRPHVVYLYATVDNVLLLDQANFIINGSASTFWYTFYGSTVPKIGSITFLSETGNGQLFGDSPQLMQIGKLNMQNNGLIDFYIEVDSLILGGGKNFSIAEARQIDLSYLLVEGSCQEPVLIQSNVAGRPVTMFAPASASINADYVSLRDVTATGGASFVANNSVDLGNNPGWTINAKSYSELYWVGGTGMWDDPAHWSFTSGGAGGACIPTAGEDVIFDANSFSGPLDIVMINVENAYCKDMRWESPTGMPSLNGSISKNIRIFGSLLFSTAMEYAFEGDIYFQSTSPGNTITTGNHELKKSVIFDGPGGWVLQDKLTTLEDVEFRSGALNTNDQDMKFRQFRSGYNTPRTLELTNSTITLIDTIGYWFVVWEMTNSNLTFDPGKSTIEFRNTGSINLYGSGSTFFHRVVMLASGYQYNYTDNPSGVLGMDTLELFGWHRFSNHIYPRNLIINPGYELRIEPQDTLTFDSLVVLGGCGQYAEINSVSQNFPVVINPTKPNTVNNLFIRDLHNNTGIPLTLTNSIDFGNNVGWTFTEDAGRDLYWVGDGGLWEESAHWSLSSGGPGGECPPGPKDNVFFDANSFSTNNQSVTANFYSYCRNMDWTGSLFNPQFNFYEHQNFGAIQMIDDISLSGFRIRLRTDSTEVPIDTRGLEFSYATFEGNGSWKFTGPLDVNTFEFRVGHVMTNGQEIFTERVSIYDDNLKKLDMSGSYWHFEGRRSEYEEWYVGGGNILEEVIADGSTVDLESDEAHILLYGSFIFDELLASNTSGNTLIENYLDVNGTDSVTFRQMELRNNTVFTGSMYGDTILLSAGKTFQLDPNAQLRGEDYIQMIGNNCTPIELKSKNSGQQADLVSPDGVIKADFVQMQDIRAVGNAPFYAGVHSTDISNNSNWVFDSADEFIEEGFLGQDKVLCDASTLVLDANNFSPGETYRWQDGSTDSIFLVNQPGLFVVDVTFTNNCMIRDSVNVLPQTAFDANLPDTVSLVCSGDTLLLDASLGLVGLKYIWQDSSTAATFPVINTGEYKVTLELGGCTSSDSTMVKRVDYPIVDLGADQTLCADSTFVIDAQTDSASYRWVDGSTLATLAVSSPGVYWADVSYGSCTTRDSININYFEPIELDLGNDTTICEASSLTLSPALANAVFNWSDGSSGNSLTIQEAGTYNVEALVNGCPAYDSISVAIQELPRFELGPDTTICEGASLLMDGTTLAGATYEWSDGSTNPTLSVSIAGLYALQTSLNGCTFADTRTLSIQALPTVELGVDQELCEEETQTLDVMQPGATYTWQDGTTNGTYTVTTDGTYSVAVNLNGCEVEDSVQFTYQPLPRFDLGADTSICDGESLLLDGTTLAGATYEWSDGSTNPTLTINASGAYSLQTTLNGCTFADTRTLNIKSLPTVDLGSERILCEGETEILDVTQGNASYTWQDGSTNGTFAATETGDYTVTVSLEGCLGSDSVTLTFNPAPVVELGNDTLLCENETLLLDAFVNPTTTYSWSDGTTAASLEVSMPGTYSLTTLDNGCSYNDEITVSYGIIPEDLLGMDQVRCEEEVINFNLNVAGATAYDWLDGSQNPDYVITEAGTYGVQVSIGRCTGGDTINVSYNPLPRFDLGSDTLLCEGDQIDLNIDVFADSYEWQDGTPAVSYQVSLPGTYTATATLDNCTFTDAIFVDYQASRSFSLGQDTTICEEDDFVLRVDQRADFIEWQDGSNGSTFTVNAAGVYSVYVEDGACEFSDTIRIDTRSCFRFKVYAPTAFSPNGDEINDEFLIGIPPNMEILSYEMKIFDRWGELLYTTEDINQGWNGQVNGREIDTGVYIYSIRIHYRDDYKEDEKIYSGDVLLIK